jgi:hypothetical protein
MQSISSLETISESIRPRGKRVLVILRDLTRSRTSSGRSSSEARVLRELEQSSKGSRSRGASVRLRGALEGGARGGGRKSRRFGAVLRYDDCIIDV